MMDGLTLKTAFETAYGMEVSEQQASELQATEAAACFEVLAYYDVSLPVKLDL